MMYDDHVRRGHPVLLIFIILCAIVEGVITSWVTAMYNDHNNFFSFAERDRIRFLVFTSWWTVVITFCYVMFFLASVPGSMVTSVASHGTFLFITWVFWLAGAASVTASFAGGFNCALPGPAYCNELNVILAFAWLIWALFTIALFFASYRGFTAVGRGGSFRGPMLTA